MPQNPFKVFLLGDSLSKVGMPHQLFLPISPRVLPWSECPPQSLFFVHLKTLVLGLMDPWPLEGP